MSTAFLPHKRTLEERDHDSDSGSSENHRPYVPKYSVKDENLLLKVNLKSTESVNSVFFPEHFKMGQNHWIHVPKHILGLDTDFSFVVKKLEEYRDLSPEEHFKECARWDRMNKWERNMYEDRIAILMQQKQLLEQAQPIEGGREPHVLLNRITPSNKRSLPKLQLLSDNGDHIAALYAEKAASNITQHVANHADIPESKRMCFRLDPPIPSRYQGDIEKAKNLPVPEFVCLMNFPPLTLPDNRRCCVMCGKPCPSSAAVKSKGFGRQGKSNQEIAFIPTQNKGLCTLCDVHIWEIAKTGMQIKWCKGCKNFRCWAAFGDKGHATKCLRCRERQREKYAAQKEEKGKAK